MDKLHCFTSKSALLPFYASLKPWGAGLERFRGFQTISLPSAIAIKVKAGWTLKGPWLNGFQFFMKLGMVTLSIHANSVI